jgi:hypothetical protein
MNAISWCLRRWWSGHSKPTLESFITSQVAVDWIYGMFLGSRHYTINAPRGAFGSGPTIKTFILKSPYNR